jgi:hypothetical protein
MSVEITAGGRIGASVGSPVPFGNIPQGASGSPIIGLVAGGWVDWTIAPVWSIVSELQFVHYGSSFSTPLDNHPVTDRLVVEAPDGSTAIYEVETVFTGTASGQFSNNYVQLPVYAAWRPLQDWRFTGGVYVGWLVSTQSYAVGVGRVGIRPEIVEKDMYFNERIRGLDYGLQLGTQYFAFDDLFVDMRAVVGLTSVFTDDFKSFEETMPNAYVQVTLAYRVF